MPLSTTVVPVIPQEGPIVRDGALTCPVSIVSDWVQVCTDPFASDNSGNEVVNPAGITRSALRKMRVRGAGTTLMLCLKYRSDITVSQQLVIQPFGFDDNDIPHRLRDIDGVHAIELTAAATDVVDGTFKYTDPVEVDLDGSSEVLVTVKTPLDTSAGTESGEILAKLK